MSGVSPPALLEPTDALVGAGQQELSPVGRIFNPSAMARTDCKSVLRGISPPVAASFRAVVKLHHWHSGAMFAEGPDHPQSCQCHLPRGGLPLAGATCLLPAFGGLSMQPS